MTTAEDVLAVLLPSERISWSTLIERLRRDGREVSGLARLHDMPEFVCRWDTGELWSPLHAYEEKHRGPLYIERA